MNFYFHTTVKIIVIHWFGKSFVYTDACVHVVYKM